jgi:hypothetical protein
MSLDDSGREAPSPSNCGAVSPGKNELVTCTTADDVVPKFRVAIDLRLVADLAIS